MKNKMIVTCLLFCLCMVALVGCNRTSNKVLVVLSAADHITLKEGVPHETGFFLNELATPLMALIKAGYKPVFASPGGKVANADKSSDSATWFSSEAEYNEAKALLKSNASFNHPLDLSKMSPADVNKYAAIFIPGGHAPMEDLYQDKYLGTILREFHKEKKPTASICHGPVALLSAGGGPLWPYRGYKMSVFSTKEEKLAEDGGLLGGHVQFYPEDKLASLGAIIVNTDTPWAPNAVADRELITGQNPKSDAKFTELFLDALKRWKASK